MSADVEAPPPLVPVHPPAVWYGAPTLGLTFGGQNITRSPDLSMRFTVIPLPTVPPSELTMEVRADAIAATYTGRLEEAVDLYRLTVERNGFMVGVLSTMAHGLLGLPLSWQGGTPEMRSALADADGTPGDFGRMFPEAECAKIFSDGVGIGLGLGQFLLMCWRCDGVEWDRVAGSSDAHQPIEVCCTCGARRIDRPVGMRQLYQLRWRDARWLWRNPITLQWYYTGRQGMVEVHPGDGEWFLFRTVPDQDIWIHGPWALGTEAAIFARDSRYDRQNTSAVCAPTPVFQAKTGMGTDPKTRADVEAQADRMRFGNKLMLPGEWEYDIKSASADYVDVTEKIVSDTADLWEVCITGNRMGTQSGTGFANMDVYARFTRERRRFYAGAWIRQVRDQGLTWWALENFGTRNAPIGVYDTRSPEDKLAGAKADEQEGAALKSLRDGLDVVGYELDPSYIEERAQARSIRVRPKATSPQVAKLPLDADGVNATVRAIEARASLGLPPFGDPRDNEIIARLIDSGTSGGEPAPGPQPAQTPATPPAVASAAPARVAEDDDEDEDDDGEAARLADEMTQHRVDACEHGKRNRCRLCGVERVRGVVPGEGGAPPGWRLAWRAIPRGYARIGSSEHSTALAQAEEKLDAALSALDALGPEPGDDEEGEDGAARARFSADQPRGPDGKFISGGGGATHDHEGRPIVTSPGTKHGFGTSYAAGVARKRSSGAQEATAKAKAGGSHEDAAKAHQEAAEQHREAAKRSVRPDYRRAHEMAAKAHEDMAKAHAAEHAKATGRPIKEATEKALQDAAVKRAITLSDGALQTLDQGKRTFVKGKPVMTPWGDDKRKQLLDLQRSAFQGQDMHGESHVVSILKEHREHEGVRDAAAEDRLMKHAMSVYNQAGLAEVERRFAAHHAGKGATPAAAAASSLPDAKALAADIHTRGVAAVHEAAAKLTKPQEAKALDLALGKEAKSHEGDKRGILEESAGWFHYHANLIGTDDSEEGQRTNKADRDSQERSINKLHQRILRGAS